MIHALCGDYQSGLGDWQYLDVNTAAQAVHFCGLIQQCVCDMSHVLIIGRAYYMTAASIEKIRIVCVVN